MGRNAGAGHRSNTRDRSKTVSAKKALSHRGAAATTTRHGRRWQAAQQTTVRGSENNRRIHWPRTLLAKQNARLRREHLRFQPQQAHAGILHCFLIDCSASMLSGRRLGRAKGLVTQLLQLAYQQRAQIAIISFAGSGAITRVFPTAARPMTSRAMHDWLQPLGGGGATPFTQGVTTAAALLAQAAQRDPAQQRWLWLLTDGRCRELPTAPLHADVRIVVDCEQQSVPLGRCHRIAQQWRADYRSLNDIVFNTPLSDRQETRA